MTRTVALLLALALPAAAFAHDHDQDRRDRREAHKDRRNLRDDLRDAKLAESLLQEFERTWAALDRNAVHAVELRVQAALDDETREKMGETRREAHELDRDRREIREDRWVDRRDLPDDRRNLADDRHDLMRAAEYRDRVNALRVEWANLRDQRVYPAMVRKHAILEELVQLSRMEIRDDVNEMREDQH
jgi:hypothetical protein